MSTKETEELYDKIKDNGSAKHTILWYADSIAEYERLQLKVNKLLGQQVDQGVLSSLVRKILAEKH